MTVTATSRRPCPRWAWPRTTSPPRRAPRPTPPAANGGASQVTSSSYNAAGQLMSVTTGSGPSSASTVSYCYDPDGGETSVVYADGNASGTAPCQSAYPWTVSSSANPTQAA